MSLSFISKAKRKIDKQLSKHVKIKKAKISPKHKLVSFTFDDFPRKALFHGANILEIFGACGTFYAASGQFGTISKHGRICTKNEMVSLSYSGHEIACHTYDHLDCASTSISIIKKNCKKNKKVLENSIGIPLQSFAYPYGRFNFNSKRILSNMYKTCRTIIPNINVNTIDLAALHSVAIYERFGWKFAKKYLDKLTQRGGWLIFHTHDVSSNPSDHGCSKELFKKVVKFCYQNGFSMKTVHDASLKATYEPRK